MDRCFEANHSEKLYGLERSILDMAGTGEFGHGFLGNKRRPVSGLRGFYVILILILSGAPRGCRISFYDYVISHSIISTSTKSQRLLDP
jgi:hypothetical protein